MAETQYAHNTRRAGDDRQPIGWLSYSGRAHASVIEYLDSGRPMGPNYMGELMWPVEVRYDEERDVTRVGFSLLAPPAAADDAGRA